MEAFLPGGGGSRLFLHSPGSDGALTRIAGRSGLTFGADASPDGRWLAYGLPYVEGNGGRVELFLLTPGEEAIHVATDGDFSRSLRSRRTAVRWPMPPVPRKTSTCSCTRWTMVRIGCSWTTPAAPSTPLGRLTAAGSHSPPTTATRSSTCSTSPRASSPRSATTRRTTTRRTGHPPAGNSPSSDRDGDLDLYVLDLASGQVRRLTDMAGNETEPHWSPDGQRLVYLIHPRRRTVRAPRGRRRRRRGAIPHRQLTVLRRRRLGRPPGPPPSRPACGAACSPTTPWSRPSDWRPGGRRPNPSATGSPMCRRCCSCPLQRLILTGNPLSRESLDIHVPAMRAQRTLVSL